MGKGKVWVRIRVRYSKIKASLNTRARFIPIHTPADHVIPSFSLPPSDLQEAGVLMSDARPRGAVE